MSEQIELGVITEVEGDRARARIGSGIVTDFLPVLQFGNAFKREWRPIRVKEQCVVISIRGSLNSGVILRGVYYTDFSAPDTEDYREVTLFSDGTKITYDAKNSTFDASFVGTVKINIAGDADITVSKTANLKANSVKVNTQTADITANSVSIDCPNSAVKGNINVEGVLTAVGVVGTSVTVGGISGAKLTSSGGRFKLDKPLDVTGDITTSKSITAGESVNDRYGNVRQPYSGGNN